MLSWSTYDNDVLKTSAFGENVIITFHKRKNLDKSTQQKDDTIMNKISEVS